MTRLRIELLEKHIIADDSGKIERRTGDAQATVCGMWVGNGGWCHRPGEWRTLFRHVPDRNDQRAGLSLRVAYWGYECDDCHRLPYVQERLESHRLH